MRLLVVEDETRIVEVLRAALGRAGFVVDAVATVADARAAVPLVAYDAVILDLGLPDGDGMELLVELRRAGNRVPVLVLTARDAVEARVTGLDAGADDYLGHGDDVRQKLTQSTSGKMLARMHPYLEFLNGFPCGLKPLA